MIDLWGPTIPVLVRLLYHLNFDRQLYHSRKCFFCRKAERQNQCILTSNIYFLMENIIPLIFKLKIRYLGDKGHEEENVRLLYQNIFEKIGSIQISRQRVWKNFCKFGGEIRFNRSGKLFARTQAKWYEDMSFQERITSKKLTFSAIRFATISSEWSRDSHAW